MNNTASLRTIVALDFDVTVLRGLDTAHRATLEAALFALRDATAEIVRDIDPNSAQTDALDDLNMTVTDAINQLRS